MPLKPGCLLTRLYFSKESDIDVFESIPWEDLGGVSHVDITEAEQASVDCKTHQRWGATITIRLTLRLTRVVNFCTAVAAKVRAYIDRN